MTDELGIGECNCQGLEGKAACTYVTVLNILNSCRCSLAGLSCLRHLSWVANVAQAKASRPRQPRWQLRLLRCKGERHLVPVAERLLARHNRFHKTPGTIHLAYARQGIHHLDMCRMQSVLRRDPHQCNGTRGCADMRLLHYYNSYLPSHHLLKIHYIGKRSI